VLGFNVAIILGVFYVVGPWLEHHVYLYTNFAQYLTIAFLSLPIAADCALLTAVFRSRGKPILQSIVALYVQPLVRFTALGVALWVGLGLKGVLFAIVVGYICAFFIMSLIYWCWTCKEQRYKIKRSDYNDLMVLMRMSAWMALSVLVYSVLRNIDILILGKLEASKVVGEYAALSALMQLIQIFPQAFSQTLGPVIARHHLSGDIKEMRAELLRYLRSASMLAGPIAACIAMFSPWFDLVLGNTYQFSTKVSVTLATGYYISAVFAPMGYSLSMTGHHRPEFYVLFIGTLFTAIMCWFGGAHAGAFGVAMGILLGFLLINFARGILVYLIYHFILFDRRIFQPILVSILVTVPCRLAADYYLPYELVPRVMLIIGVCILIFCAFWLLIFTHTERSFFMRKIRLNQVELS
jgi:O-antigen/teichoic acid export membrane protein